MVPMNLHSLYPLLIFIDSHGPLWRVRNVDLLICFPFVPNGMPHWFTVLFPLWCNPDFWNRIPVDGFKTQKGQHGLFFEESGHAGWRVIVLNSDFECFLRLLWRELLVRLGFGLLWKSHFGSGFWHEKRRRIVGWSDTLKRECWIWICWIQIV